MEWYENDMGWAKEIQKLLSSNGYDSYDIVDNKNQPIVIVKTIENEKSKSPKI